MLDSVVKLAAGPWSWSAPLHRSRCGASHQRRGVPCQDASLCASLQSADGLPVGLMAVADGHGGSRYWLSDVGSRLACELAIAIAAEDLAQRRLSSTRADQLEAVRDWLADDLPQRLVAAWQQAIAADWQQRERPEAHQDDPFSSQTYGSTLALVVLTPHWWAHTGLGDWDLVLLSNHQPDRILSQEADQGLQGEATESLCLPRASRCFAARTAVYPLSGKPHQACGLVLSTDGIRKSCATDADHLALSRYLLEESQPHQAQTAGPTERLDASLDRISREGSGDDVSVALACFGTLQPVGVAAELPQLPPLPPLTDLDETPTESKSSRSRRSHRRPINTTAPNGLMMGLRIAAGGCLAVAIGWALLKAQVFQLPVAQSTRPRNQTPLLTPIQTKAINTEIKQLCKMGYSPIRSILLKYNITPKNKQAYYPEVNRLLAKEDWRGSLILLNQPDMIRTAQIPETCTHLREALNAYWTQQSQQERTNKLQGTAAATEHPNKHASTIPQLDRRRETIAIPKTSASH